MTRAHLFRRRINSDEVERISVGSVAHYIEVNATPEKVYALEAFKEAIELATAGSK